MMFLVCSDFIDTSDEILFRTEGRIKKSVKFIIAFTIY
jgi:hypothetical protein